MSDVLQKILASDWNPQRGQAAAADIEARRGTANPPSFLENALAGIYRGIRPSQENLGGLVAAIKPVYHGSPHAFDQFKLDKIGTGEGAQAYGHGLYFAESPGVARSYQKSLTPYQWEDADTVTALLPKQYTGSRDNARQIIQDLLDSVTKGKAKSAAQYLQDYEIAPDLIPAYKRAAEIVDAKGNMYEASLRWPNAAREAADPLGPQHFLDWDKSVSAQSEVIKSALQKRGIDVSGIDPGNTALHDKFGVWEPKDLTGERAWMHLYQRSNNPKGATDLREAGIPGIRYLDGGSRGAGQGTSNYVVFDDNIIEVLKRNGAPIK